ncbi:hypothetical protein [Streptomyces sp. NPDC006335]|uniref:hypothetical protein n=1 Tax=Streptomyces sp. NPDC006335 TaxID=3156895 RepID=UPI0033A5F67F
MTQEPNWCAVLAAWTQGPAPYWLISNAQEQLIDLEEWLDYALAQTQPTIDTDEEIDL